MERLGGDQPHRNPTDAVVENFGWPCYEGNGRQSGYDGADLTSARTYTRDRRGNRAVLRLPSQQSSRTERERARSEARRSPGSSSNSPLQGALPGRVQRVRSSSPTIPATASGSCRRTQTAIPHLVWSRPSSPERQSGRTWKSGPAATCSTSISTAERSGASRTRP